jgi:hypothetical protein
MSKQVQPRDIATIADKLNLTNEFFFTEKGSTPLIAAMRCYVASKLGDDVKIPNELAKEV